MSDSTLATMFRGSSTMFQVYTLWRLAGASRPRHPFAPRRIGSRAPARGMEFPVLDPLIKSVVEADEAFEFGIVEIDGVGGSRRIVCFFEKRAVGVLKGAGHIHLIADAQEQRARIFGQAADEVGAESVQIQIRTSDERGH